MNTQSFKKICDCIERNETRRAYIIYANAVKNPVKLKTFELKVNQIKEDIKK